MWKVVSGKTRRECWNDQGGERNAGPGEVTVSAMKKKSLPAGNQKRNRARAESGKGADGARHLWPKFAFSKGLPELLSRGNEPMGRLKKLGQQNFEKVPKGTRHVEEKMLKGTRSGRDRCLENVEVDPLSGPKTLRLGVGMGGGLCLQKRRKPHFKMGETWGAEGPFSGTGI